MTFVEHKEATAKDCEEIAALMIDLAAQCREGNMDAFVEMWLEGGTEDGDARIQMLREIIVFRFVMRQKLITEE